MTHDDDEQPAGSPEVNPPAEDVERVGYKRPPKRTRFRKGQSGNPKGRPKGSLNESTLRGLIAEQWLDGTMKIVEGGRERQVARLVVLLKKQAELAFKGDRKAINDCFALIFRVAVADSAQRTRDETTAEDEAILRNHCSDVLDAEDIGPGRPDDGGEEDGRD
ncbi:DUF5681 domain-containing protein [Methylobacterium sp. J-070]|uniref:DUF5681 domain-containing protein n=1 Tax=Methylobacterium sp. J-070 TaxID=2836650 RepID=UPI001FBB1937|nr:DUF5681 domain-containing protein [Methylobacterium sp. J-070]MCJ2049242.1 DUF5681 domain-containing protein [Methylobacterium sp. J-070]